MYNIGFFILSVIMTIASIWIVQKFWSIFYEKSKLNSLSFIVWSLFAVSQMLIMYGYGKGSLWMPAIIILQFILISFCCYQKSGIAKIAFSFSFYIVWALIEIIIFIFLENLLIEKQVNTAIGTVVSKMIMIIGVNILSVFWRKKEPDMIPLRYFIVILMFPMGSIYIVLNQLSFGSDYSNSIFAMIALSILLLFNIVIFDLFSKISNFINYEKEKSMYIQQINDISRSTSEKEKMMGDFYKEKHNLTNELIVLKKYVVNDEKDNAIDFLNEAICNFSIIDIKSDSGNMTVDTIINTKYAVAKEHNIAFDLNISIPNKLPFDQCDIGIVLGNALDNAIEAVAECKEKVITISMSVRKKALIFVIKNPYERINEDGYGNLKSLKTDANKHGYGMSSIKKVVEKYNGVMVYETDNKIFSLNVIMSFE